MCARTRTPRGSDGRRFSPQGFAGHLLVADAVVDQRLVPHGVQGVLQGLGAKLVGLEGNKKKTKKKNRTRRKSFQTNDKESGVAAVLLVEQCLVDVGGQR